MNYIDYMWSLHGLHGLYVESTWSLHKHVWECKVLKFFIRKMISDLDSETPQNTFNLLFP